MKLYQNYMPGDLPSSHINYFYSRIFPLLRRVRIGEKAMFPWISFHVCKYPCSHVLNKLKIVILLDDFLNSLIVEHNGELAPARAIIRVCPAHQPSQPGAFHAPRSCFLEDPVRSTLRAQKE